MEFYKLAIIPSRKNLAGVLWNIIGRLQQVPEFVELLGRARRNFLLVKPPWNSELLLRERIVIPTDAPNDGDLVADERLIFQPMPTDLSDPPRQPLFEQPIAVIAPRPQFMIPGNE